LLRFYDEMPRLMSEIKLVIPSCACGSVVKPTLAQIREHCRRYDVSFQKNYECGQCNNTDLWFITEMLWSKEDEHLITPCCHTEAYAALLPEDRTEDYDQDREDRRTFRWAVTGR
jgi:hypothetical protein